MFTARLQPLEAKMALDEIAGSDRPKLWSPDRDNIPEILRSQPRWIVWTAIWNENREKYGKVPVDPKTGFKVNALDPSNQMTFEDAWSAYSSGIGSGIGIVMTGDPVDFNDKGEPLYLVGIDLDDVQETHASESFAKRIYQRVRSYTEVSPSGNGLRTFVLSTHKPRSGQTEFGEIYVEKRFLTVTGRGAQNNVTENSAVVVEIDREWWAAEKRQSSITDKAVSIGHEINRNLSGRAMPEITENIAQLKKMLGYIDPNCDYQTWRNIVWAIMSTGWECAMEIALQWSMGSGVHWGGDDHGADAHAALEAICNSFDPSRNLTLGTVYHHAYAGGVPRDRHPTEQRFEKIKLTHTVDRYPLLSREDLARMPEPVWVIHEIFPDRGVASIYGAPSSGKTFIGIDLACRISLGHRLFFGREVGKRPVVYLALEGGRGIAKRLSAWDKANGIKSEVQIVLEPFSLLQDDDVDCLCRAITAKFPQGSVVIIDTLAQASPGADENTSKDMGIIVGAANRIATEISGLVVMIHHSGKDASRGLRGHSSLNGAMDAVISITRDEASNIRTWKVAKMKDADDGASGTFELQIEQLGIDNRGNAITSCSVREVSAVFAETKAATARLGTNQKSVLNALKADNPSNGVWDYAEVLSVAKTALDQVPSGNRSTRAKEAIDSLCTAGHIIEYKGGYSLK
jgi:hypothetical protein